MPPRSKPPKYCPTCTEIFSQPTCSRHCKGPQMCRMHTASMELEVSHRSQIIDIVKESAGNRRKSWSWPSLLQRMTSGLEEQRQAQRKQQFLQGPRPRASRSTQLVREGADATGSLDFVGGAWVWRKQAKAAGTSCMDQLRRESAILTRAAHLGVVPRLHAFDEPMRTLVLEFVSDIQLAVMTSPQGERNEAQWATLEPARKSTAASLIYAVRALHDIGVFHNDLHDRNILLRPHVWAVVVVDFGDAVETSGTSGPAAADAKDKDDDDVRRHVRLLGWATTVALNLDELGRRLMPGPGALAQLQSIGPPIIVLA